MADDPQVLRIMSELEHVMETVVKEATEGITKELINTTPVDTGFARSNWIPSTGEPVPTVAGVRDSSGIDHGPQVTGLREISMSYKISKGTVYISNKVPYITILNTGTSTQAPRAFVQKAIVKGIKNIGKA